MNFIDGTNFSKVFETQAGPVEVFAEVHVFAKHLVLDGFLFFPYDSQDRLIIGVGRTFEIIRQLRSLAKKQGFEEMTISYHRIGKPRPGRIIARTRKLE